MPDDKVDLKEALTKADAWDRAVAACKKEGPSLGDHFFGTMNALLGREPNGNGQDFATNNCIARRNRENSDKSRGK